MTRTSRGCQNGRRNGWRAAFVAAPLLLLTGCLNLFTPFDGPSGDAQLLSGARAALDRGDFSTALQDYQKLSPASGDFANSEQVYATLLSAGAGMAAFAGAFGSGDGVDPGKAITSISNAIGSNANASTRQAILSAYKNSLLITDNSQLQGFVRLLSSFALIGEILSEAATTSGHLVQTDIVNNPAGCIAAGTVGCAVSSACGPGNAALANGPAAPPQTMSAAANAASTPAATLSLIQTAIDDITADLALIGPGGSFSSATGGLTSGSNALADTLITAGQFSCYRLSLLSLNFGAY